MMYDNNMGGVRYAQTLLRLPEPQKWSIDDIKNVLTTPRAIHESEGPEVIHHESTIEVAQKKPAQVRRLYIMPEDLEAHGYTNNCKPCPTLSNAGCASLQRSVRRRQEECASRR